LNPGANLNFTKSGTGPGRIYVCKSSQVCLRPDLKKMEFSTSLLCNVLVPSKVD